MMFEDTWGLDDIKLETIDALESSNKALWSAILNAGETYDDSMMAYLCFMGERLIEMHRILKPTGSIYLHIDPTASHYLKTLMDAIFGSKNFRNEIIWKRVVTAKSSLKWDLARNHDVVLRYTKSSKFVWNRDAITFPYDMNNLNEKTKKQYNRFDTDGRRFRYTEIVAPGERSGDSGKAIKFFGRYILPPGGKHWVVPGGREKGETMQDGFTRLEKAGRLYQAKIGGLPRFKRYLDEQIGWMSDDIWVDIPNLTGSNKESTKYRTQKPLALLERIIKVSSNAGDVVLDPFCGCATACVAAERLNRQWIGIDKEANAYGLVLDRLYKEVDSEALWNDVGKKMMPGELADVIANPHSSPVNSDPDVPKRTPDRLLKPILYQEQGGRCNACGFDVSHVPGVVDALEYYDIDHIIPVSKGGSDTDDNKQLLCPPCNKKKSNNRTTAYIAMLREEERKAHLEQSKRRQSRD